MICRREQGVLIPGCWNRVVNGDEADCHCDAEHENETAKNTRRIIDLETRVANLEAALAKMEESK